MCSARQVDHRQGCHNSICWTVRTAQLYTHRVDSIQLSVEHRLPDKMRDLHTGCLAIGLELVLTDSAEGPGRAKDTLPVPEEERLATGFRPHSGTSAQSILQSKNNIVQSIIQHYTNLNVIIIHKPNQPPLRQLHDLLPQNIPLKPRRNLTRRLQHLARPIPHQRSNL